jgi:hypothetical protein
MEILKLDSVGGFSLFCLGIWTLSGAKNFQEFRYKAGSILPDLRKNRNQGRTEFENLTELFQYVIDEDNKKKEQQRLAETVAPKEKKD